MRKTRGRTVDSATEMMFISDCREGMTTKEIAEKHGVAMNTVYRVFHKYNEMLPKKRHITRVIEDWNGGKSRHEIMARRLKGKNVNLDAQLNYYRDMGYDVHNRWMNHVFEKSRPSDGIVERLMKDELSDHDKVYLARLARREGE